MFTSLRLRNFRGFADTRDVPLGCLTIIVGPNNAGKSSLLHSLLLLRQTMHARSTAEALVTSGPFLDVGSFDDIVRGGATKGDRQVRISLKASKVSLENAAKRWPNLPSEVSDELDVSWCLDRVANRIRVAHSRLLLDSVLQLGVTRNADGEHTLRPRVLANSYEPSLYNFIPFLTRIEGDTVDAGSIDKWLFTIAQQNVWSELLQTIEHIAPLRLPVPRYTVLGRSAGDITSAGGEALLNKMRSSGGSSGGGEPGTLVERIDYWISKRFEMLARLKLMDVDAAGRVLALLGDEPGGYRDINIANMGEGISQLLPVVASVVTALPRSMLLVEQPEIHLHPAAQADLADLFIDSIGESDGPQFLVETHSEHLLLRVRRRIAEGKLRADQVSVLYVERDGRTHGVRRLPLNEDGNFEEWPTGFFEEGYAEALLLAQAPSKRKGKK